MREGRVAMKSTNEGAAVKNPTPLFYPSSGAMYPRVTSIVFLVLATTAFCSPTIFKSNDIEYGAVILLLFIAVLAKLADPGRNSEEWRQARLILLLFLLPQIVFYGFTIVLHLVNPDAIGSVGTNVSGFAPVFLVAAFILLFGREALRMLLVVIGTSVAVWGVFVLCRYGVEAIVESAKCIILYQGSDPSGATTNYFEVHDITFAAGYLLLLGLATYQSDRRFGSFLIACSLFLIVIGLKRIQLLALIIAVICFAAFRSSTDKRALRIVTACIVGIACYVFLDLVLSGAMFRIFADTNFMGRQYYWSSMANYASFDPGYVGIGRNAIAHLMKGDLSYLRVGGVHSDILKIYVESGFFLFTAWLVFFLFVIPAALCSKFKSQQVASFFMVLMVYSFVLYATDNVENYLISQSTLILCLIFFVQRNAGSNHLFARKIRSKV